MQESWQESLKNQLKTEFVRTQDEWVDLNISTAGLLNLTVVSNKFQELSVPERKEQVLDLLGSHKLRLGFLSAYTIQEASSLELSRPQNLDVRSVKTWQDLALFAANPQNQPQLPEPNLRIPQTIAFYSFKGGVGRTTALAHVACILAERGRKVVVVDLDLEAPGLSTVFNLDPEPSHGIVDYFYERAYLPQGVEPKVAITQIFGEVILPNAPGRLFVVPAGFLDLEYISKVDDLRATSVNDDGDTLWSVFSSEIQHQLAPEIIIIDSRTGINDWSALSLLQAANTAIIFLFPNEQNLRGINLLLQSLQSLGKPMHFVFSPVPDSTETARVEQFWQLLKGQISNNAIANGFQSELAEPLIIPYLSLVALADGYPIEEMSNYYNRIANLIDANIAKIRDREVLAD